MLSIKTNRSALHNATDDGWIWLGKKTLLICALTIFASPTIAANKYWVGVGASATTNAPTSGTWQTTTPTVWSDGTVATTNAGWVAADTAFFGGADGAYGVQVAGSISMVSARF